MTENQPETARTAPEFTPEQQARVLSLLADAGIVLQPWQRRLLFPPMVTVFYGARQQADRWARKNGVRPRDVILATNPDALRGYTGRIHRVVDGGWRPTSSQQDRVRETEHNIRMIEVTRG